MVTSAGAMTLGVVDASNDEERAMTRSASLYNGNSKILRVTLRIHQLTGTPNAARISYDLPRDPCFSKLSTPWSTTPRSVSTVKSIRNDGATHGQKSEEKYDISIQT